MTRLRDLEKLLPDADDNDWVFTARLRVLKEWAEERITDHRDPVIIAVIDEAITEIAKLRATFSLLRDDRDQYRKLSETHRAGHMLTIQAWTALAKEQRSEIDRLRVDLAKLTDTLFSERDLHAREIKELTGEVKVLTAEVEVLRELREYQTTGRKASPNPERS